MTVKTILNTKEVSRAVRRMAHEIVEKTGSLKNLAIIGIQTEGVYLARRIAGEINKIEGKKIPVGTLDITMYRDDAGTLEHQPVARETNIPFNICSKVIIQLDDVLCSGRTARAALSEIIDFGRPKAIRLVVLVDRGLRELPIRADFVGKKITTTQGDRVEVELREMGKTDKVVLKHKSK